MLNEKRARCLKGLTLKNVPAHVIDATVMHVLSQEYHADMYDLLINVKSAARSKSLTLEDLVDVAIALKSIREVFDDLLKEMSGTATLLETIICVAWQQRHQNDPTSAVAISGRLGDGTPDVKIAPKLPRRSKDPERFAKLMAWMQIPQEVQDLGLVNVHWPSFVDYVTTLSEEGKPLPPGINPNETYTVARLRVTRKREVVPASLEEAK